MAYAKPRANGRYTAVYQTADGKQKSAGTYATEEQAVAVAVAQEAHLRTGSAGVDPETKATMTIAKYSVRWLKNHKVQPSTKGCYQGVLKRHILPRFGTVRVSELQREAVRALLVDLSDAGASASEQRHVRACLSAMMQTAYDDGYRSGNPVRGLRVDTARQSDIIVMTRDQFGEVYNLLPTDAAMLFANFIVSTGCRFGEAAALLVSDFNFTDETLTIGRALQDVGRKNHPDGKSRFHIGPTKTGEPRTIDIDEDLCVELQDWIAEHDLSAGDLVFPRSLIAPHQRRGRRVRYVLTDELVATLGTFIGPNGVEYGHGTLNGYVTGKCRCDYCGQASADYRYERQQLTNSIGHARGDQPSDRFYDTSDFLYDGRWSEIWQAACQKSTLTFIPTAYQLRHTCASWAIEDGMSIRDVMEQLGHRDMTTTSRYVKRVSQKKIAKSMAAKRTWGKKAA